MRALVILHGVFKSCLFGSIPLGDWTHAGLSTCSHRCPDADGHGFGSEDYCLFSKCWFRSWMELLWIVLVDELTWIVRDEASVRLACCPALDVRRPATVVAPPAGLDDGTLLDSSCGLSIPAESENVGAITNNSCPYATMPCPGLCIYVL